MAYVRRELIMDTDPRECRIDPVYPQYSQWGTREETFRGFWPSSLPIAIDTYILNGFFYARQSDIVVCHYCGNGLHSLTATDDVLTLHAALFGTCMFLHISHTKQRMLELTETPPTPAQLSKVYKVQHSDLMVLLIKEPYSRMAGLMSKLDSISIVHANQMKLLLSEKDQQIQKLNDELNKLNLVIDNQERTIICQVCFVKQRNTRAACGHTLCDTCAQQLIARNMNCPTCRIPLEDLTEIFLN